MNKLHRKAIELKYEGKTHQEISDALDGRFTRRTIDTYFGSGGLLYTPYWEYCEEQSKLRMVEARNILKKEVANAAKVIIQALAHTLKEGQKNPDKYLDKQVELAEKVMDRAGLAIVTKTEISKKGGDTNKLSDDELDELLRSEGLDPATGLPVRKAKEE